MPDDIKDLNKEFQYLWKKYNRDDWKVEDLADYCGDLETLIMNYLSDNDLLNKNASKRNKKDRVDLDVSPELFYSNYDYIDQTKSEKDNGLESGPGGGLYHGKMDKYKSVKDFIETDRRRRRKKRKKALLNLLMKVNG